MEFKIKPTTNGYVVEFTGDNKKGKDQNLKIWIDSKVYRTILLNPEIPDADKLFFVQSEYREKQDQRKGSRQGDHLILSLDQLYEESGFEPKDDGITLSELINKQERVAALYDAIENVLTPNERLIIKYRYIEDLELSSSELADRIGVSERHLRRLHNQAINKLKNYLLTKYPEVFIKTL